jgi:hypothetical protein
MIKIVRSVISTVSLLTAALLASPASAQQVVGVMEGRDCGSASVLNEYYSWFCNLGFTQWGTGFNWVVATVSSGQNHPLKCNLRIIGRPPFEWDIPINPIGYPTSEITIPAGSIPVLFYNWGLDQYAGRQVVFSCVEYYNDGLPLNSYVHQLIMFRM